MELSSFPDIHKKIVLSINNLIQNSLCFLILNFKIALGQPMQVWMIGSSLVKEAFIAAKSRPGGTSLGLGRINVSAWWLGKSGMTSRQIKSLIRMMKRFEDPPHFLILRVSGNDLGAVKVGFLRNNIKNIIR